MASFKILTTIKEEAFKRQDFLRQVEGARLEKNGWVSGHAWLRSASSCVELKKYMDVSSTFVAKNSTIFSYSTLT